jgi:dienelactone hydrolase
MLRLIGLMLMAVAACLPAEAQDTRERITIKQTFKGKAIAVTGELYLPPGPTGSAKVPAMIVHHGSGGISDARERRYARELVKIGVAALVLDSFTGRGVTSTVSNQAAVSNNDMLGDAFAALKALAAHARIDGARIGIMGFSKGGSVALLAAHEVRAAPGLPAGLRFALHVPFYPSCSTQHYKPKTTGAPIYLLLGGADTYVGVAPCRDYAAALKAEGARIETVVFQGAMHGFDGGSAYRNPRGENYSRCIFAQQSDGSWQERVSGATTNDASGKRVEAGYKQALARCRTFGVSGGPNAAARAEALTDLKTYVQRHLLNKQP